MSLSTQYAYAVPKAEFDPATLTGTFSVMNGSGFSEAIRIWKLWNPSETVSIEISFDGVTPHDFIPPQGTLIVDFQANNDASSSYGNAVKQLKKGQLIWGRTAPNPTFLQIMGYI